MTTSTVQFSNFASTTLVGTYSTGDIALTVSSAAAFPAAVAGTSWFYAVISDSLTAPTKREIVKVTNKSGSIFTVTRGQDGTTAQTWATGSYIELRIVNSALQDLFDEAVSDATTGITSLSSTGDVTITVDSDNNGAGAFVVKSGPDTVLQVKNGGELVANPGYANIKHFGGDPTGVTDIKAAFDLAIAAGYTKIYFPAGTYVSTTAVGGLSTTNQNLHIFGDGPQSTIIKLTGASGFTFLTFTGAYNQFDTDQLIVEDLSIQTACASGAAQGTAIKAVMNASSSTWKEPFTSVFIKGVEIGALVDNACFAKGIELDTCQMAKIDQCFINGFMTTGASTGTRSGIGIDIYSRYATNNNVKGTDINITDSVVYQCTKGIQINHNAASTHNFVEGVHIDGCTVLNCTTGIKIGDTTTAGGDGLPGWFVDNCHITATDYGIDIQTMAQFFFSNNLIYSVGGTNFAGVYVVSPTIAGTQTAAMIQGNTFVQAGTYSGNTYGVSFIGADATPGTLSVRVSTNSFDNFTNSVKGDANTIGVVVTPDNYVLSGGGHSITAAGNVTSGFSGNVGINTTPPAQSLTIPMLYVGNGALGHGTSATAVCNGVYDGANWKYIFNDYAYSFNYGGSTGFAWYTAPSGTAGNNITFTEKLHLTNDGRLYGTALHNNAGAVTGTTNQYVASGTYSPTLTGVTNIAASTTGVCQWIRVGNVVTVSGKIALDVTAAGATELGISLPIASTFASDVQCAGTAHMLNNGIANETAAIACDTGNARAALKYRAVDVANNAWAFTFTYLVV